jgi:DNA polymerase-3 subunit beta
MTKISFTADRITLGSAIGMAAQGLPSRPVQPVYAGMLFTVDAGIVHITGSDGDVTFVSSVPAVADDTPGSFILPGKITADIFRYLTGREITVEYGGGLATITAGRASYTFSGIDGDKYPAWLPAGAYLGSVDGAEFADAVRFVVPAASRSDSRPTLRTVALSLALGDESPDDELTMVATDSYRMAVVKPVWSPFLTEDDNPPQQVLVPSWVMERFARVCDEEVAVGWNGAVVTLGTQGLQVTARSIGGKYLDWPKVIAKYDQADLHASADVLELTRAVKAAQLIAGVAGGIHLEFSADGHIHVRAQGNGSGDEMIGTDYCGETVSFIIGPQMMLDGLAGCDEEVEFSFSSNPLAPVFMEDDGFRYFMQPRVSIDIGGEPGDQPAK